MKRKLTLIGIDLLLALIVCYFIVIVSPSSGSSGTSADNLTNGAALIRSAMIIGFLFAVRLLFRIYRNVWRYANTTDYFRIVESDTIACVAYYLVAYAFHVNLTMIRTLSVFALMSLVTLASRFAYRILYDKLRYYKNSRKAKCGGEAEGLRDAGDADDKGEQDTQRALEAHDQPVAHNQTMPKENNNKIGIAIIGAGNVGTMLAKELMRNPASHYQPIVFVDNEPRKIGSRINGIKVISSRDEKDGSILDRVKTFPIQEIVIAIPKMSSERKTELYNLYAQTGCKVKIYDYPLEDANSLSSTRTLREFRIEDLLFRDAKSFDIESIKPLYEGLTVLVTGGGGSIGSELCRQITKLKPSQLIIFDCYENNAYDIEQELKRSYGDKLNVIVEIGSVRDPKRLDILFDTYRPDVVFHAAAHKHVPLMEHNCGEAIKNNVFGTLNTANAAEKYGVKRFLLISTDKAVNPTNVMGASKRLCEMIIQSKGESKTKFMAVRFGNVLGSNGSVIPLFSRQIKSGGPITLTDKRIIRYFMTIPEAAQLLLETCAMAGPGEIYVLDMGKPVKILDLAENMIRLSGLTPYVDIDIKEVGLRPGEKLYEELLIKTEELDKTDNQMIFIERDKAISRAELEWKLKALREALESRDQADVVEALHETVPTFHLAEEVNEKAAEAEEMKESKSGVSA